MSSAGAHQANQSRTRKLPNGLAPLVSCYKGNCARPGKICRGDPPLGAALLTSGAAQCREHTRSKPSQHQSLFDVT
jgi:hypothetical protein